MKRYKIIIVEDDEDERLFMKEGFEAANMFDIIAQVENGNALFEWLNKNKSNLPNVILSDLNMPGKSGYDIITEIKNNSGWSHIPVIITSTSSTKTIIEKCLAQGAADYLVKPDTFVEYLPFVKDLYNRIQEKHLAD